MTVLIAVTEMASFALMWKIYRRGPNFERAKGAPVVDSV